MSTTVKIYAVINDQTDNNFCAGNLVKFGLWFLLFSTEVRLTLLNIAVSANSFPTPPCQRAPAPTRREDREQYFVSAS